MFTFLVKIVENFLLLFLDLLLLHLVLTHFQGKKSCIRRTVNIRDGYHIEIDQNKYRVEGKESHDFGKIYLDSASKEAEYKYNDDSDRKVED